jgi:prevent-host-death family protein
MATQMGIRELRDNLTTTIRRVRAGETIEITNNGEPVAVLSPAPTSRIAQLVARGEATLPERPARWRDLRPIRGTTGEKTASEWLQWDRGEY